jgi:hypothetical protein
MALKAVGHIFSSSYAILKGYVYQANVSLVMSGGWEQASAKIMVENCGIIIIC